jgi:signal transduction histidine kinase
VNNFLATSMGIELTRFLGHTAAELFGPEEAATLEPRLAAIFAGSRPVDTFELQLTDAKGDARSWLVNFYPVKSGQQEIRWVGAVMIDTTERRRSEETLRRTEKLAAAGQLAASIAHEINNPLEAVTNLLFLLRTQPTLDGDAVRFTEMAQHEVARVSEIAQQTLRFYRPSTSPALANVGEILDSILTLHSGRVHTLRVDVTRRYGKEIELYCLSGALRQVFANLITNALDALNGGGRLMIRARRSHCWKDGRPGVRVVVADTGSGMPVAVRRRIFEPFFTTKMATGTGLGLWVTLDIMEKHQGLILVRSRCEAEEGASGTVFMLFFPDHGVGKSAPAAESIEQSAAPETSEQLA